MGEPPNDGAVTADERHALVRLRQGPPSLHGWAETRGLNPAQAHRRGSAGLSVHQARCGCGAGGVRTPDQRARGGEALLGWFKRDAYSAEWKNDESPDQGPPLERVGRHATGLRPESSGYGRRAAGCTPHLLRSRVAPIALCRSTALARATTQEESMTLQEFFDALKVVRAAGYRPYLVAQSSRQLIRLTSPTGAEHCPITAVCERHTGQTFPPLAIYSIIERLGLDPDDAYTIAAAADGQASVLPIREQLLTALAPLDPVVP
jgi:hypothetical protein